MLFPSSVNMHDIPDNIQQMFGIWIKKINKNDRDLMAVGSYAIVWNMWKLRNKVVFENNRVSDPCVRVNLIVKHLHDWNVLQKNPERIKQMMAGVRQVEQVAEEVFRVAHD